MSVATQGRNVGAGCGGEAGTAGRGGDAAANEM